jgi:hypothetical protein
MKSIICSNMYSIIFIFHAKSIISIFIGCATRAPDGSSPRGYSQIFLSIGSEVLSSFLPSFIMTCTKQFELSFLFDLYTSSGARSPFPMGVAPEAMVGFLETIIYSKIPSTCISSIWLVCTNQCISKYDIIDMTTHCDDLTKG